MRTAKPALAVAFSAALLFSLASSPAPAADYVQITDTRDGGCLSAGGGNDINRLPVVIDVCTPDMPDDKWRRPNTTTTTYRNKFNDACLVTNGHDTQPNTSPCDGGPAQKWIRRNATTGVRLESARYRGWCIGRISGGAGVKGDVSLVPCARATIWR
ncbi:RICIN domain-containing protein [Streptomyces sp. NPDC055189]